MPIQQHQIFERLSTVEDEVVVLDFPIEWQNNKSSINLFNWRLYNKKHVIKASNVKILRTPFININLFDRITSIITQTYALYKILKHYKPNVVVLFSISNSIPVIYLSRIFKIKVVFYSLDKLYALQPIRKLEFLAKFLERWAINNSDHVFIISKPLMKHLENLRISNTNITLIPSGIYIKDKIKILDSQELKVIKNKIENQFVITFIGLIYNFSGLDEILINFNYLPKNTKLLIVGDGESLDKLRRLVIKLNLSESCIFTGRVPSNDIYDYIALSDVCLVSFKENPITEDIVPIKIYEYLSSGKPVLSRKLRGIYNEFNSFNNVFYYNSIEDFISNIYYIKENYGEIINLSIENSNVIKKNHNWEAIVNKFRTNIIKIING
jgi:glycosyltransferase involved in cell wall biosynthesis